LVVPGYSPSKRYQPYPQPQCLLPGQLLVFGHRESTKRHGPQYQLADLRLNGSVPQPLAPVDVHHPRDDAGVTKSANSIFPSAEDYDVEMNGETCVPEADLVDVEMEDDFLPPIPAIIVSIFLA